MLFCYRSNSVAASMMVKDNASTVRAIMQADSLVSVIVHSQAELEKKLDVRSLDHRLRGDERPAFVSNQGYAIP